MAARSSQPYVGPRPFETTDRRLFFGREREADDILSLIMFHRTVLLYAQSGAGKSSLINTLIIPDLQTAGFATPPVVRIRGAPAEYLNTAANVYVANILYALIPEIAEPPPADAPEPTQPTLLDVLRRAGPPPGGQGPVLVFDQFEELFTTYQDRWPEREAVFAQIAEALDGIPTLRVLFSMREDFIAELDPLIWRVPQGIDVRYRLELLRRDAAISAVIEPSQLSGVTFDGAAAARLVRDLRQINAEGRDGRPQQVDGEYIEPVQLQIVCKRLWDRLPEGIEGINESDLEQFGDVSEALREFYLAAVRQASELTNYPEKLIHLGCTQFVTASGTRSMVHRAGNNIGMLPIDVVTSLVDQHFLRAEIRAAGHWYEISHDRLIAPVLERKLNDEELKTLLRTRDLLEANLENWKAGREFEEHSEILTALSRVENQLVLSNEELEFLCMSSIGTGFEIAAWVGRLKAQVPQLLESILLGASRHLDVAIRRNAAVALAQADLASMDTELVRLVLEDPDAEVRKRAASAMAHVNRAGLMTPVVAQLTGSLRRRSLMALARMRDEGVADSGAAGLAQAWLTIGLSDRILVTLALGGVRLRQRWPMILYIGTLGGLIAGLYCASARVPAAVFSLTITNLGDSLGKAAGSALFQGMAGGIVWGGFTSAWIALGWILIRRQGRRWMNNRYAVNLLFGILGGTFGGIGVFAEIFFVFEPSALSKLHWIPDMHSDTLGNCIGTGYCLFHPALGPAYGAGIGLGLAALHASARWQEFLAPHIEAGKIVQWQKTARHIIALSITYTIASGPLLFLSGLIFVAVKGFPLYTVLGETATIYIGNIGTVAGILLGQLIMRVGFVIPPLTD
jgi:hypothetical protein